MILTNNEIYNYASELISEFNSECDIKLPIKVNFFLQKNIKTLTELAQEIDNSRMLIAQQYGELNAAGTSYVVPAEKMVEAQRELNELLNITQNVSIHIFKIDDFNDIELSYKQMNALLFMIEE